MSVPSLIRRQPLAHTLPAGRLAAPISACGGKLGIDLANSRPIRPPFVVLPARQATKASDPVLVLGGGPGSSAPMAGPALLRDDAAGQRFQSDAELVAAASARQARLRSQGVDLSAYSRRALA